jgi:hypothetical protein
MFSVYHAAVSLGIEVSTKSILGLNTMGLERMGLVSFSWKMLLTFKILSLKGLLGEASWVDSEKGFPPLSSQP